MQRGWLTEPHSPEPVIQLSWRVEQQVSWGAASQVHGLADLARRLYGQVGGRDRGWITVDRPVTFDHANRVGRGNAQSRADVLGNPAPRHLPAAARHIAAHRVDAGPKLRHPVHRDQVFSGTRAIELAIRELADQVPGGQLPDGLLDLVGADVVTPGEGAWPWQPPPRLVVHECGRQPVSQNSRDVWLVVAGVCHWTPPSVFGYASHREMASAVAISSR